MQKLTQWMKYWFKQKIILNNYLQCNEIHGLEIIFSDSNLIPSSTYQWQMNAKWNTWPRAISIESSSKWSVNSVLLHLLRFSVLRSLEYQSSDAVLYLIIHSNAFDVKAFRSPRSKKKRKKLHASATENGIEIQWLNTWN